MKNSVRKINPVIFSVFTFLFLMFFAMTPYLSANAVEFPGVYRGTSDPLSGSGECEAGKLCNPIGSISLADFIGKIGEAILKVGIPIAAIFIIFAGLKFVMAAGDEKAIKDAKQIFWYTIIGTAILLGAGVLAKILETTIKSVAS